ncbi:MAG: hypothetical protein IJQ41_08040 [Firmicutes bacterium]|nr:hypothetical protein [Bacillota bacterium]MBR0210677.1 hypothetical protein [Bacillota bacterium]MBR0518089.1 hypothetical protein [Bacillota bacterium]
MSSKVKIVLLIVLLVIAFIGAKMVFDRVSETAYEPSPAPAGEVEDVEEPATVPDEETGTDDIAWNYDEFPDDYTFRNNKLLSEHYDKHGIEMGFASKEDYEAAANVVIHHPDTLHKIEKEDGDTCFYLESANAFVVLSTDGYIRTFFCPDSGKKYYDKQ